LELTIVSLVEQMLDLHRQHAAVKTPHKQTALDRQIAATDARIDRLVYDLYGLTEEEMLLSLLAAQSSISTGSL